MTLLILITLATLAFFFITRTKDTSTLMLILMKLGYRTVETGVTLTLEAREKNEETDGLVFSDNKEESIYSSAERNADIVDNAIGMKDLRTDSLVRRGKASNLSSAPLRA